MRVIDKPQPPQKRPPKPTQQGAAAVGAAMSPPPKFEPHGDPPHPVLQKYGFNGGIHSFNEHVDRVVAAHRRALGYDPPPGVVLDVVRSPLDLHHYDTLFPGSNRVSRLNRLMSDYTTKNPDFKERSPENLMQGMSEAAKQGPKQLSAFFKENHDDLTEIYKDPAYKNKIIKSTLQAYHEESSGVEGGGFLDTLKAVGKFGGKATTQIAQGLTVGPALAMYEEGRAGYHDVGAVVHGNVPTHLVKTNVKMGKMAWQGFNYDLAHPGDRPGYLFLDVIGAGGVAGSLVTRVGRAATAESAGEAAQALVRRPVAGTVALRKGGHTEQALLSENPTVAAVQRVVAHQKNKRMQARFDGTDVPGGLGPIARSLRANRVIGKMLDPSTSPFSGEASLRREMNARKRTESVLLMEPKRELERVAGWSINSAPVIGSVLRNLPQSARKGLTVGEQKALQVITLDDPNPLQTWRQFHNNMIQWGIGDARSHRAQLTALNMAEKALKNPSKRFKLAIDATYRAIETQERIKKENLGLNPETADKRVIAYGEVVRSGQKVGESDLPTERMSERSAYIPSFQKGKGPRRVSEAGQYAELRQAGSGFGPGRDLPELKHEFTGESIRAGDFRIDTTNLVGETFGRTVRLATIRKDHVNLWSAATDTPRSVYDRPIRSATSVPSELKKILQEVDQGQVTAKDVANLHPEHVKELLDFLYPGKERDDGTWAVPDELKGKVKWVSQQHMDSFRPPIKSGFKTVGQVINEPFRDITLFARLAYALNAVSNAGMVLLQQGHYAPANFLKATYARKIYGDNLTDTIDALVGQSKSKSFAPDFDHVLLKAGRQMAYAWNKVADQGFRRAAIIHELERKGIKGKAALQKALVDDIAGNLDSVNEARRRANKAMVEFDNLTWTEREILRNWVFVYPWVSRSLVWSVRSILEHPVKVNILAHIGGQDIQEHPEIYKYVPEWFKQTGYVPVGYAKDGSPKVINPTSINVFTTLQQMVGLGEALTTEGGQPSSFNAAQNLFGPAITFGIHAATGRDDYGNPYPGPDLVGAAKDLLVGLPQESAMARAKKAKNQPALKPFDITDRRSIMERQNEALHRSVFSPGWLGGYGMLISGGMTDRAIDQQALISRYWQERPGAERHKLEMTLIRKALKMQGDLLKTPVPAEVSKAVDLAGARTWAYQQETKKLNRTPTPKEQAAIDIRVLAENGRITGPQRKTLEAKLNSFEDPTDVRRFKDHVNEVYGGAQDLRQWDSDVRFVASFNKTTLQAKFGVLRASKLTDMVTTPGSQDDLHEAGRMALKYVHKARQKVHELDNNPDSTAVSAEIRAWQDSQDHPLVVNGKRVAPSPVRLLWATQTEKERQNHLSSLTNAAWEHMSNFDKELMGKKVAPHTSEAYAALEQVKSEYRKKNPGSTITRDQVDGFMKELNKMPYYKGVLEDYFFARKPKVERFELLRPYRQMPERVKSKFDTYIGNYAKQFAKATKSGNYDKGAISGTWKNYISDSILPWLKDPEQRDIWAWVQNHGGVSFLTGLPTNG